MKATIPLAGLGTGLLPATNAQPRNSTHLQQFKQSTTL